MSVSTTNPRYVRRIIQIKGADSPNVRYALAQVAAGLEPTHETITPGVLTYREYLTRRSEWDKVKQCISLDAEFYEGSELLLFPPEWLNLAEERWRSLPKGRPAKAGGCDPAEGGDKTAMCAVDEHGVIELTSRPTPNTNDVAREAIAFMQKHDIPPDRFVFDRGGGGKQHADRLRAEHKLMVRSVGFGESTVKERQFGQTTVRQARKNAEDRYEYVNRRAQMYGELSEMLDPTLTDPAWPRFALPPSSAGPQYQELRRQLAPMPKLYDREGRIRMLPKNRNSSVQTQGKSEPTLGELLGCSPDEADSLVLAIHGMRHKSNEPTFFFK